MTAYTHTDNVIAKIGPEVLSDIFAFSALMNRQPDIQHIVRLVVDRVPKFLPVEGLIIILWPEATGDGNQGDSPAVGGSFALQSSPVGNTAYYVVTGSQSVYVPDSIGDLFGPDSAISEIATSSFFKNPTQYFGVDSQCLGVPLQLEKQILGVLYAYSAERNIFSPNLIRALEEVANLAAIAIGNLKKIQRLEEINRFQNLMSRMVVHNLNAPLHLVQGYCELLFAQEPQLETVHPKWVTVIRKSLWKMESLIDRILDYERLITVNEADNYCRLEEIAHDLLDFHQPAADRKNQVLNFELSETPLIVRGDRFALTEALTNLVANAIKYSHEGCQITIRVAGQGVWCMFQVEDNGPGINPDDFDDLFKPFVRLANNPDGTGTGLGLSLAKMVVERFEGHITLESSLGAGTRFIVTLPRVLAFDGFVGDNDE